jgi:hypothetical protein
MNLTEFLGKQNNATLIRNGDRQFVPHRAWLHEVRVLTVSRAWPRAKQRVYDHRRVSADPQHRGE